MKINKKIISHYMNTHKYGGHDNWTVNDFRISNGIIQNGVKLPTVFPTGKLCMSWGITETKYNHIKKKYREERLKKLLTL